MNETLPNSTPQHPALVRVVDLEAPVRRKAIEDLSLGPTEHLFALREALLRDDDASVRAAVPPRLAESQDQRVVPWLLEAVHDRLPSVREACWRALARLEVREALPAVREALAHDEVWWVRRAALRAAVRLAGDDAAPVLIEGLADPFWRTRYAAAQALVPLVTHNAAVRAELERLQAEGANEAVRRAARWTLSNDDEVPLPDDTRAPGVDEDPAVTTAQLERAPLPEEVLVRLLGDPHEPLRRVARRRLAKCRELAVARKVVAWLDEARVPYAAETARALLDEMLIEPVLLAREVLADAHAGPGALAWACAAAVFGGELEDVQRVRLVLEHPNPPARAAAAAALVNDRASAPLVVARLADEHVQAVVARWFLSRGSSDAEALVFAEPLLQVSTHPLVQVAAARALGRLEWLEGAVHGTEGARAGAVAALTAVGRAVPGAETDPDPRVRLAAMTVVTAPRLALNDPDPTVRRRAAALLTRERRDLHPTLRRHLVTELSCALDPELRAAAPTLVLPEDVPVLLGVLLRLSNESVPAVRASAATALEFCDGLLEALDDFLAHPQPDELRRAAYTWRLRAADGAAVQRVRAALETETGSVREHLRAMLHVFSDGALPDDLVAQRARPPVERPRAPAAQPPPHPSSRPLGHSGVLIPPLVISGANELEGDGLAAAVDAGLTSFFWEPGYQALSRFLRLRRSQRFTLVCGTYHSGAKSLRRDVESHLRSVGRETLDVYLLFWVRSPNRLDGENLEALEVLRAEGKVRTFGFSTHLRDVATKAAASGRWPVIMTRHSAAHPAPEAQVFPAALRSGTGVLTFTATCYARMLQPVDGVNHPLPTAAECYQYSLSQPGVSAVISAPRTFRELQHAATVLRAPELSNARLDELRAHGRLVRAIDRRFNALVRSAAPPPHP